MGQERFQSVEDVARRLDPSYPVFCVWPEAIKARARAFLSGFPGTLLYAVKCNPHPFVLQALYDAGVHHFDTASLPEIAQVNELFSDVHCYFNHPVKGRGALDSANKIYGITDYVVDSLNELCKVAEVVGTDITVEVRMATPKSQAVFNLSDKFGATPEAAAELLQEAAARGMRTALAFHVGSQCSEPDAYRVAMSLAADVIKQADVQVDYLDIGGGFPAAYTKEVPALSAYFDAITTARTALGLDIPLMAEPGRALVADGCALLTQVHLRRGGDLYINDGVYGCLSEIRDGALSPPVRAVGRSRELTEPARPFRIFGPTCDPIDVLQTPFTLPGDIQEGDWICIAMLGAYSLAIASGFNGFITDTVVKIDGQAEQAAL